MSNKNKTLLANWVEERQCEHLEEGCINSDGTLSVKLHKSGHKGILYSNQGSCMDSTTTVKESYVCPSSLATDVRIVGKKQELLTKQLYNIVSSEVEEEFYPPPSPPEYTSTTKKDFDKDFTPTAPPPKQTHNVYTESPATYWAENSHSVTGVTQVQKTLSPFHKNSAFSTPIEEYLDQPKPHDIN